MVICGHLCDGRSINRSNHFIARGLACHGADFYSLGGEYCGTDHHVFKARGEDDSGTASWNIWFGTLRIGDELLGLIANPYQALD